MSKQEKAGVSRYESQRDLEHTRQTLLEAGARVFAEKGLAGTRIDDLVSASGGVNRSMIYYIFGSKHDLYREVLRSIMLHLREEALGALLVDGQSREDQDFLQAFTLTLFDVIARHPHWARLMLREVLDGAEDLRASAASIPDFHVPKEMAISLLQQAEGNPLVSGENTYPFVIFMQMLPWMLYAAEPVLDVVIPQEDHGKISRASWRSFLEQLLTRFSQGPADKGAPLT